MTLAARHTAAGLLWPQMARALCAWLAPQSQTRNALASNPLQHALCVIMPGCFLTPVLDSRSLGATASAQGRQALSLSLVYWQHRSALLQTCAAATSPRVDAVRGALSRGGLGVALTAEWAERSTPGLLLPVALERSNARTHARALRPTPGSSPRCSRRPVGATVSAHASVLRTHAGRQALGATAWVSSRPFLLGSTQRLQALPHSPSPLPGAVAG
jgi:hypothetical protein